MDRIKIEEAVKVSSSFREVSNRLGIAYHGHINKIIKKLGIDTSHFRFGNEYKWMIGKKFGKLTVLSLGETISGGNRCKDKSRKRRSCKCVCDCGNEIIKVAESVKDGLIKSCGCAYIDNGKIFSGKNNPAWSGVGDFPKSKYTRIKFDAKKRNIDFCVSQEYLWSLFEKQDGKCALSGIDLTFGKAKKSLCTTASLDRINNKIGYIEGNVQWVHKDVNLMKNDHEQEYFLELCTKIAKQMEQNMNCPKCNYPEMNGKYYKGDYSPDSRCDGCGFVETNVMILNAYRNLRQNIDSRYSLEQILNKAIFDVYGVRNDL